MQPSEWIAGVVGSVLSFVGMGIGKLLSRRDAKEATLIGRLERRIDLLEAREDECKSENAALKVRVGGLEARLESALTKIKSLEGAE